MDPCWQKADRVKCGFRDGCDKLLKIDFDGLPEVSNTKWGWRSSLGRWMCPTHKKLKVARKRWDLLETTGC